MGDNGAETAVPGTRDLHALLTAASERYEIARTVPEDIALLHFTSGTTTGKPKGAVHVHEAVVAHITGKYALDLHPEDVYWCTADPGWVTGTSYGIIAPLTNRVMSIVDEAEFDAERWYRTLQEQRVTVWYPAPTAIRMMMKLGAELPRKFDTRALRFLASVGEPLNPEAMVWGGGGLRPPLPRQLVTDGDGRHHDRELRRHRHPPGLDGASAARGGGRHRAADGRRCRGGDRRLRRPGRARPAPGLAIDALLDWRATGAALDEHLADELVPFLALADGRSAFTCPQLSEHLRTVAWLVQQFLSVGVAFRDERAARIAIAAASARG